MRPAQLETRPPEQLGRLFEGAMLDRLLRFNQCSATEAEVISGAGIGACCDRGHHVVLLVRPSDVDSSPRSIPRRARRRVRVGLDGALGQRLVESRGSGSERLRALVAPVHVFPARVVLDALVVSDARLLLVSGCLHVASLPVQTTEPMPGPRGAHPRRFSIKVSTLRRCEKGSDEDRLNGSLRSLTRAPPPPIWGASQAVLASRRSS